MQGHVSRSPVRRAVKEFGCFLLAVAVCVAPAFGADTKVEQRIQRIQDNLLPPVLVNGESPPQVKLADRMTALHVPGVSVAVIHDGKIEWARGFGVTKIGGAPVTVETLFQAASISKPVTALAVLRLAESGKLNLDTDVNQYLKNWKLPANSFTDQTKVTLRQLLTHTAGMTVHGFAGYSSDAKVPTLLEILDGQSPANSPAIRVDTLPGTKWRYSGGGYVITQQLLEDVTGKRFERLMQESVLKPIGMDHSTYEQPLPNSRLKEVAMPYRSDGEPVKGGPHIYPEKAPAGLWTTPSDLARYAIEVQRALAGNSKRVISESTTREMLTPGLGDQGLGPHIGGSAPQFYFEHGGANEGYRCNLVVYENGDGAIIMTNGDNGGQLMGEILRTIAYEYKWPDFAPVMRRAVKIEPTRFDLLLGSYRLSTDIVLTFTRDGERYIVQTIGLAPIEILAASEHEYFTTAFDSRFTFTVDEQGKGAGIVLHQDGRDTSGKRLDEATAKPIVDKLSAANKRFQEQAAQPGAEEALRKFIADLASNKPDYAGMGPALAETTRQQLPQLSALMTQLGSLRSVTFKGVGVGGADIYGVVHEHGATEWRISLSADGKIERAGFQINN